MTRLILLLCLLYGLSACSTTRRADRYYRKKITREVSESPVFSKAFTGFYLSDALTGRPLAAWNAQRYFTPASNAKILTLAACLKILGDSIPAGTLYENGGEAVFSPAGDPTFLHPAFEQWQALFARLRAKNIQSVAIVERPEMDPPLGPGWCWDDVWTEYSPERSAFPIYGNVRALKPAGPDSLHIFPPYWQNMLQKRPAAPPEQGSVWFGEGNQIYYADPKKGFSNNFEQLVPVFGAGKAAPALLADTLHKNARFISASSGYSKGKTVYSTPVDTVYRHMMHHSDNFFAEQLLILCAWKLKDSLKQYIPLQHAQNHIFPSSANPPLWVDGSGLSRYNQMTPQFLSVLLRKMYLEQDTKRLFSLFPAGGISGTVKNWYGGQGSKPFVFAKTGSMSGVHSLSGYLVTRSGRVLVFSFMHNNFPGSNKAWKMEMQRILLLIRDAD